MDRLVLTILTLLVTLTRGYPTGPPEAACVTRTPNHGVEKQKGECPYAVYSDEWSPGGKTEMAMFHDNEFGKFKGYLISISYNDVLVGKMSKELLSSDPEDLEANVMCGGTSISHASGEDKSYVYFEWEAPNDLPADANLIVNLTVVQEKETFWVDCQSYALRPLGGAEEDITTTTTTTTEQPQKPEKVEPTTTEATTEKPTTTKATTERSTTTESTTPPTTARTTTLGVRTVRQRITTPSPAPVRITKAPVTVKRTTKAAVVRTTQDTYITSAPLIPGGRWRPNPNYHGEPHMGHDVLSPTQCSEAGNYFTIVAGTGCKRYTQSGSANGRGTEYICPGPSIFDPRVCACAFSSPISPCPLP